MTSISRLETSFAQVIDMLKADAEASAATVWGRTSEFWQDIFGDRSNFPTTEDFIVFRRGDFGYGMADERQGAFEREHAARTCEIFRQSVPVSQIVDLDESAFGAPFIFENFGACRSAAFWTNAVTALRIAELVSLHSVSRTRLRVLEIGAGWGCASYLIHQLLDVKNYTIIDLPENLFLSTNYLAATRDLVLSPIPMDGSAKAEAETGTLAFGLPGCLSVLSRQYDLVVNSFSFQEMDLATVEAYFSWIRMSLSPDGLFVSLNTHGKAGVRRPSDYPLSGFRLVSLGMFRSYPTGFLNTIPYEMALELAPEASTGSDADLLDVICCLLQFGLGDDLREICRQFVGEGVDGEAQVVLRSLKEYFSSEPQTREIALQAAGMEFLPAITAYLRAMHAFRLEKNGLAKTEFLSAISHGLAGLAKLRACVYLSLLDQRTELSHWAEDFDALFAYPEIRRMLSDRDHGPLNVQFDRIVSVGLA